MRYADELKTSLVDVQIDWLTTGFIVVVVIMVVKVVVFGAVEVELVVEVVEGVVEDEVVVKVEEVVVEVIGISEEDVGFKVVTTSGFMVVVLALQTH